MTAFGDSMVFLAVFTMAATLPSGAGLYFLRPVGAFWEGLSFGALAIAATAVAAAGLYVAGRGAPAQSGLDQWASWSVLRILLAPMLAIGFAAATVFAPGKPERVALGIATALEALSFAVCAVVLFSQVT